MKNDFSAFALWTAGLSWLTGAYAYTTPVGNPTGNPIFTPGLNDIVPAGSPYAITWNPTTTGTVSLVLLRGPSTNVLPLYAIAEGIQNTGSFSWTPSTDLEADTTHYGLQLIVDSDGSYQYSTQFGISNNSGSKAKTSSSSSSSSSSISISSASISSASTSSASISSSGIASSSLASVTSAPGSSTVWQSKSPISASGNSAYYTNSSAPSAIYVAATGIAGSDNATLTAIPSVPTSLKGSGVILTTTSRSNLSAATTGVAVVTTAAAGRMAVGYGSAVTGALVAVAAYVLGIF